MKKLSFCSLVVLAGLNSGSALAACNATSGDGVSTICISINSYDWQGDVSSDFLQSANWDFGELFNAPTGSDSIGNLPVQFRAEAQYVNGFFVGYNTPSGPAVLSSNYTSTSHLNMGAGVGAELTIENGATYTLTNAYIGQLPTNNFPVDSSSADYAATLNLSNGHVNGNVIVGADAAGVLNVSGTSSIDGNVTLAQSSGSSGEMNIASGANWTLSGNLTCGAGSATINNNSANSVITGSISCSTNNAVLNNGGGGVLTFNQAGATIGSAVNNNGQIVVTDGSSVTLSGAFSGSGSANLNTTGSLALNGSLAGNSALAVNGGNIGFNDFEGTDTLALSGNYNINHYNYGNSRLAANITNAGQAILTENLYSSASNGFSTSWRNLNGGSLALNNSSDLVLSTPSYSATLINDTGATLSKTGTGNASVGWDVVNNGNISVANSSGLLLSGSYSGNGTANLNTSGSLALNGSLAGNSALAVNGGNIGFYDFEGTDTLALSGNYNINHYNYGNSRLAANITNAGQAVLTENLYSSASNGFSTSWRNLNGGSLALNNSSDLVLSTPSYSATLINDAGATLSKTGTGNASVGWDVVNNGIISVANSSGLLLSADYSGNGTAFLNTSGSLALNGNLTANSSLTVNGGNIGFYDFEGTDTLALSGNYNINHYNYGNSRLAANITNSGQAILTENLYSSASNGFSTSWRNLNGGSLALNNSSDLVLSTPSYSATLINDTGATISKTGTGNASVGWDVVNNGNISVANSSGLLLSADYSGNGTATLNTSGSLALNGNLAGNSSLAVNGGNIGFYDFKGTDTLALSGSYNINHYNYGYSRLATNITNAGQATLNESLYSSASSGFNTSWRNLSGSALIINNSSDLVLSTPSYSATLINDAGATISKTGTGTTGINWDVVNNGNISVANGNAVLLSAGFSGNGTANLDTSGSLALSGNLAANSSLAVNGGNIGFYDFKGTDTLALSGNYNINHYNYGNSRLATNITNAGQATLNESLYSSASSGFNTSWRNLNGGSLAINNGSDLILSSASYSATLINDAGAALNKTGTATSNIDWDIVNNGLINIQSGTLSVSGDVNGSGTVAVNAGTILNISSNEFQTHTLTVDSAGTLDFNGDRLEVVNFQGDFYHDRGVFAPGASPAVSTLSGDYTMTGSSIFEVEIAGTQTGLFDQLIVGGDVNLTNADLSLVLLDGFTLAGGELFQFMVINGMLNGTFSGLGEGSLVGNYGLDVFITYLAGDGNDIALYTSPVPLPAGIWLMLSGLAGMGMLRKRGSNSAA